MRDVVRFAPKEILNCVIEYYEEEIGRLLAKRQQLLAMDDDAHDALAIIVGETIINLIGKLEELK